jgi:hypothetical protein
VLTIFFLTPVLTAGGAADIDSVVTIPFKFHAHGAQVTPQDINRVLAVAKEFLKNEGIRVSFDSNHKVSDEGNLEACPAGIDNLLSTGPGNVHIVDKIPCCGEHSEERDNVRIVGCSGLGMAIIVLGVSRPDLVSLRAVQWMHELGHSIGLCHSRLPVGLMIRDPGATDTAIDDCERQFFKSQSPQPCNLTRSFCSGAMP